MRLSFIWHLGRRGGRAYQLKGLGLPGVTCSSSFLPIPNPGLIVDNEGSDRLVDVAWADSYRRLLTWFACKWRRCIYVGGNVTFWEFECDDMNANVFVQPVTVKVSGTILGGHGYFCDMPSNSL